MPLTLLLGLGSSICWGTADFFGGLQSRRLPALTVVFWSQLAGEVVLLGVVLGTGQTATRTALLVGALGGAFSSIALTLFYRGLAIGAMSIVAPVSACGAVLPATVGLATGRTPSGLTIAGLAAALAGVVLVSLPSGAPHVPGSAPRRTVLGLAFGAALGFGMTLLLVGVAAEQPGSSPLGVVAGVRAGSVATLVAVALLGPVRVTFPGRMTLQVAATGVLDTGANCLYAAAVVRGGIGVVSVLASLYPVATVVLARIVLRERLSRVQLGGVGLALGGVAMLGAG